jgi:ParB family chromosome partitioning protein
MSVKDEMAAMTAGLSKAPTVATKRAASALTAPGALMAMNSGYRELQAENDRLKQGHGKPLRVRMDLCDDGPYHVTPLDPERVKELKANLAENPQSAPALVRVKADGRFEIIAGRHRKAALLELDQEEWDVVIRDIDDDQAERLTFYDNLFAPTITDYAKFRGFASRKERRGLSFDQLAKEAGVSKSLVGALLSFGKLPEESLSVVASAPKKFGYNMVSKLAAMVDEHRDAVARVVELVAQGKVSQDEAPAEALKLSGNHVGAKPGATSSVAAKPARAGRVTVEWGGKPYATIDVAPKSLTIKMADKGEAEAVMEAVKKALEARAKKARP